MAGNRKQKIARKFLSILMLGIFAFGTPLAHAQEGGEEENGGELFGNIEKQIIQLTDEGSADDWNISGLETTGLKFLVRGKEALTWSLSIEDGGFHNEAIEKSYKKVLTIVNSLFILGLLVIALMWMFSILIPRKYLKKVILIYSLAVVFINFALPINQLFIDGTNLLQKTLLTEKDGNIQITDIVQTPPYADVLSYKSQNEASLISGKQTETLSLKLAGAEEETTSIGKIRISEGEEISEEVITLNNREVSLLKDRPFSLHQEQTIFRFSLIIITGIAYFIIALIFVLRIVILWALLILSPILFLLAIFQSTRGWFYNWLAMYGRWLLIGPIAALGIAVIVNIWQLSGLPISVSETYSPELFLAEKNSNIVFYLPGKDTANTLSNTQEMMEYIIFLIMLYLPIFLAFGLTRQKHIQAGLLTVGKTITKNKEAVQQQLIQQVLDHRERDGEERDKPAGIVDSFKRLVNDKIDIITQKAMPIHKMKVSPETPTSMMPTASNFLPDNLSQTPIPKMLELLGREKTSKASHKEVIKKLATSENIGDKKEKEKVMAIMNEIHTRADQKDNEAIAILHEVQTIKEINTQNANSETGTSVKVNLSGNESAGNININVNDAKPESDRKVRDSSFDSKSEEKGKNKKEESSEKAKEENVEKPNAEPKKSNSEENAN